MMTQVSLSILVSVSGLTAPTREITAALRVWPEPLSSLRLSEGQALHLISYNVESIVWNGVSF